MPASEQRTDYEPSQSVTAEILYLVNLLVIVIFSLILFLGGIDGPYTWMIAIIYFTIAHSSFIILGMIGLIKALEGLCWSYPLVGKTIPDGG